jgi:hypothetical protein
MQAGQRVVPGTTWYCRSSGTSRASCSRVTSGGCDIWRASATIGPKRARAWRRLGDANKELSSAIQTTTHRPPPVSTLLLPLNPVRDAHQASAAPQANIHSLNTPPTTNLQLPELRPPWRKESSSPSAPQQLPSAAPTSSASSW